MNQDVKIGFLGAGRMATALAEGFIRAEKARPENLMAGDPFESAREAFERATQAKATENNAEVVRFSQVLILAVKPNQADEVLWELKKEITSDHLIVSIVAGASIQQLESSLTKGTRIVRVMPNTPALVGCGAAGYSLNENATPEDGRFVRELLSAVGLAFEVKESLLDAVTGLSGSGPAYVYQVIEAMSDGGVAAGLPRDVATQLAAQTVCGAARMVLETKMHPGALKDMVASPGGTTIEGVHELEKGGLRAALMNAVRAAAKRSKELGNA